MAKKDNNATRLLEKYAALKDSYQKRLTPWLLEAKEQAKQCLEEVGLPTTQEEAYRRSDINALFDQEIGFTAELKEPFSLGEEDLHTLLAQHAIPNLATHQVVVANGECMVSKELEQKLPNGAFVGPMEDFLKLYPHKEEKIKKAYFQVESNCDNGVAALNSLFSRDVIVVYLPEAVTLSTPVQLVQHIASERPLFVASRFLIYLEKGAKADLIFNTSRQGDTRSITSNLMGIVVEEEAQLALYDVASTQQTESKIATTILFQDRQSRVLLGNYQLGNGFSRSNYHTRFRGEEAQLQLDALAVGHQGCRNDIDTRVEHLVPNCHTDELVKYLLQDDAVGAFTGRIFIANGAVKTLAYQQNRNLLLSPEARVFAKPFLEIYADDVRCSHGMTTGQLDEEALFYMRQRGIDQENARLMLSIAFARGVLDRIALPELQAYLMEKVDRDFYGIRYEEERRL